MTAKLYVIELSHPSHAARLMLEHKGIEHHVRMLPAGLHPVLLRAAGFRGGTVPALKIDGRKIQGSLDIARELERLVPDPPLYPADPEMRAKVDEIERWAEAELQPLARRLFRWTLTEQFDARRWLAGVAKLPAPGFQARTNGWLVRRFATQIGATATQAKQDLSELPAKLDRVDGLIADGTLSLDRPNAALFQAGTSVRALTLFPQLQPLIDRRPCGELGRALLPEYPQAPAELPEEWLAPLATAD